MSDTFAEALEVVCALDRDQRPVDELAEAARDVLVARGLGAFVSWRADVAFVSVARRPLPTEVVLSVMVDSVGVTELFGASRHEIVRRGAA